MQYMLLLYADPTGFLNMPPEEMQKRIGAYAAYSEALKKEGVLLSSNRLRTVNDATTVKVTSGKTSVLNGPYAESKEQLGGYFLIDVPDLDAAISWAARCPGASHGKVEIRPVWTM